MTSDRLTIRGLASVGLLLRVVNLLAQNDAVLRKVTAELGTDVMVIDIDMTILPDMTRATLVNKLHSLVEVAEVN